MTVRYATAITMYKKTGRKVENTINQGIFLAENEEEAIQKAIATESVSKKIADDFKIYWKVAMEIPELNQLKTN